MPTRFLRLAFAALLLAAVIGRPRQVSAQAGVTYFITNVDSSQFPNITFQVRVVDLNNQVVGSLGQNLPVYENGQPVSDVRVTPSETGPLNVIFAVDLGRLNRFGTIRVENSRLALTTLVTNSYFRDDLDQLEVMARQNTTSDQTVVLWPATSKGVDLINFANNFQFPRSAGNTKGLLVVEDAINEMLDLVSQPGTEAAAIVFLTRFIEDPSGTTAATAATSLAQSARERFINVYSIQFDTSGTAEQPLINLTSGANGTNTPVSSGDVGPAADQIFKTLATQRTVYSVTYRSTLGPEQGLRTITLNSPENPVGSLAGTYTPSINQSIVTISQPANGSTIRRTGQAFDANGEPLFDIDSLTVGVDIAWPDGVAPRNLTAAELRVNGVPEASLTPPPDATHVDFTWDVSGYVNAGPQEAALEVTLIDELGVESIGTGLVTIDVALPATAVPTVAVTATSAVAGTVRQYGPAAALALICMGLLAVALVGAVIFMRPKRRAAPVRPRPAGRAAPAGGGGPDHTIIVGAPSHQNALATLTVLEGPRGMIGEAISLTKPVTVMGRNPELADVVFYPDEPSSLSRVHCTIQLDGKYFVVTDSNSTNGTRINGELLKPSDPVQLRDGDELVLGDLGKLGVKMRFSTSGVQDHTELKDRTYIVDDYEQQDWDKFKDS